MHATPPAPTPPTTQQIRTAIGVIQIAVRDPHADPVEIAAAHRLLVDARRVVDAPVRDWLDDYLGERSTTGGAKTFCLAIDTLAQHFKLPEAITPPAPGEQAQLFR